MIYRANAKVSVMRSGIDYVGVTTPFLCNDGKGNFVLHRRGPKCRDEKGCWDFGSGKLEFGETLEHAVLREAREEYGITGKIQEQLPAYSLLRKQHGKMTHWLVVPFLVKVDVKKARMMEQGKATAIGIFRLDALPKPLHTGARLVTKKYRTLLKKYS